MTLPEPITRTTSRSTTRTTRRTASTINNQSKNQDPNKEHTNASRSVGDLREPWRARSTGPRKINTTPSRSGVARVERITSPAR